MAELSTSNGDYDFGKFLQNVLNALYVAKMKWLIPTDQKASVSIVVQARLP